MVILPLASQHLDVKTIGRGGPSQRLFKSNKWTPPFACLSTVAGRSGPAAQCPKGVNRVVPTVRRSLPVYPDKQTFSAPVGMSQRCQFRKWQASFDHLVGAGEQRRWHVKPES